jgi:hypothetical protein
VGAEEAAEEGGVMEVTEVTEDVADMATETSQVREDGEVVTPEVTPGHTPREGELIMMKTTSISRAGRGTDTTPMTSTYQPVGPWSETMTTIGTNCEARPHKFNTSSPFLVVFFSVTYL